MNDQGKRFAAVTLAVCMVLVLLAVVGMLCWQSEIARRVVLCVVCIMVGWCCGWRSGCMNGGPVDKPGPGEPPTCRNCYWQSFKCSLSGILTSPVHWCAAWQPDSEDDED